MNFVEQVTRTNIYTEEDIAKKIAIWCKGEWRPTIIQLYNFYEEDYSLFKERILDFYNNDCKIKAYKNDVVKTHIFTDEDFECIHKALKKYVDEAIKDKEELKAKQRTTIIHNLKRDANKIDCVIKIYDKNGNEVNE